MTDRVNSLTVALEVDVRDDCLDHLRNAILQLRGVTAVGFNISDAGIWTAQQRAKQEMRAKVLSALD